MLSMVVVMISMSMASIRRIGEVLNEKADLTDPEDAVTEVADGSIDFNHVNFSYKHGSGKKFSLGYRPAYPKRRDGGASSAVPAPERAAW